MSSLQNFPFNSFDDFKQAYKLGKVSPVIPKDFARQWASKSPDSPIKASTNLFYALPMFMLMGMIIVSFVSEPIKWYHGLIVGIISVMAFNSFAHLTPGPIRKLVIYSAIGLTIYFFISGRSDFGILMLLSLATLFFWEFTYFNAIRACTASIMQNPLFFEELWDKKILMVRFADGKTLSSDKEYSF